MLMSREQRLIISHLTMRRLIGMLGISLPFVMVLGGFIEKGFVIQGSISGYYYTNMRDFFVGLLCIVSIFLISYKGYESIDNFIGNLSGVSALGMIMFPTGLFGEVPERVGIFLIHDNISNLIHLAFGTIFFMTLAFNSIFIFTKRQSGKLNIEKKHRNLIYRICGIVMILSIIGIIIYLVFLDQTYISKTYPVFLLESVALIAFGISWLVKGNTFFKDQINHSAE